jgi:hypothetical protein
LAWQAKHPSTETRRQRFVRHLRRSAVRLLEAFTPGGTYHSECGVPIHVSANGTTSVDPNYLREILFKRFAEAKDPPV